MVTVRLVNGPATSLLVLASIVGLIATANPALAWPYVNSSEAGCNGSDPNALVCEDFETSSGSAFNSFWSVCGDAIAVGGAACGSAPEGCAKGWASAGNPLTGTDNTIAGAGRNASRAATHNWQSGPTQCFGSGAHHPFAPDRSGYNEIYVRWYQKWPSGYQFGAEKVLTFNQTAYGEGIFWGNIHCNQGAGSTSSTCGLSWQGTVGSASVSGGPALTSGVWWAIQVHIKIPS